MGTPEDHYTILGVSPHADERAVKVAYFARVREYPPESHPQEFARIRSAYEVLSNPEERARYDESLRAPQPQDQEAEALWNAARAAQAAGDGAAARRLLERLVELRPGATGAWHALGSVCLEMGAAGPAERAFQRVQSAHPDSYAIHLDLARAHHALEDRKRAKELAGRALELAGQDPGARVAVADVLILIGDVDRGRRVIEEVIAAEGAARPIAPLVLRLARSDFARKRRRQAVATVTAAVAGWRGAPDEERLRAVGAFATFAAECYEAGRRREGDAVLAACHAVAPETAPPPPRMALLLTPELEEGDRAWLEGGWRPDGAVFAERQPTFGMRGWAAISALALALLGLSLRAAASNHQVWGGVALGGVFALHVLLGGAFVLALRVLWRRRRGRLGQGLILDHAHLLRVAHDRVRTLPLLLLRTIQVQGTFNQLFRVRLGFCGRPVPVAAIFRTRVEAESFAAEAARRRRELVQQMGAGRLVEVARVGAFPPSSVAPGLRFPRPLGLAVDRRALLRAGAVVLFALSATAFGGLRGERAAADERWRLARTHDTLTEYLALAARTAEPHAADAAAAAATVLDQARERWRAAAAPGPGAELVSRLLDPAARRPPALAVRVIRTVDAVASGDLDPGPALALVPEAMLGEAFARALRTALGAATRRADAPLVVPPDASALPTLTLRVRITRTAGAFRPPRGERAGGLPVLRAEWQLEARTPWRTEPESLAWGQCEPPDVIPLPQALWAGGGSPAMLAGYAAQQRALLLEAITRAVAATGAPAEPRSMEGAVGALGAQLPPGPVPARPNGANHGR